MTSQEQLSKAKEIIQKYNRVKFSFLPTPLQPLERLSKKYGVNLFIKRDDLTGPGVFGGNKARKLEYLIADALDKDANYVFTYGATQSNHAMQVATVCRRYGLNPILYLIAVVTPKEGEYRSNLLLDKILDAEIHIMPADMNLDQLHEQACKQMKILEKEGHKCYDIPAGGANAIGSLGFAQGFLELIEQTLSQGIENVDYIAHATGTGGTLSGLLAGKALLRSDVNILSFTVGDTTPDYVQQVVKRANESLALLGVKDLVLPEHTNIDTKYYGDGYEIPTIQATNALKLLAREEGIFLDPVYTAKAMSGLIDYIEKGKIPQGSNVVFWHTGGATGLFAEKKIIGDIDI
jgi:L-cysteate sulfo-lyase